MDLEAHAREVEGSLEASEGRAAAVLAGDDVVVLVLDPKTGRIVEANAAAAAFYGASREELRGKPIPEVSVLLPAVLLREMQRLKEFNENILQGMTEGVVVEDAAGFFTFVNPAGARMLGYTPEELIGEHWEKVVAPEQRELVIAANARRTTGAADRYELTLVSRDGRRVPALVSGRPQIPDGCFAGTVAVFTDIAELKQAGAAERRHRIYAETLAEVTMALASQTDPVALLDEILRQARRLVRYESANIALLEGPALRVVRCQGYERFGAADFIQGLVQPLSQNGVSGVDGVIIDLENPRVIVDTRQHASWFVHPETAWIRSNLSVPIRHQARVLGLLRLDGALPAAFTAEDGEALRPLADAAAVALENTRLFADAQQRAAELEAVRQASLGLTARLGLHEVLTAILEATLRLLPGLTNAHVFLYRDEELCFGAALGAGGLRDVPRWTPRRNGLTYAVARSGEMIVVADMRGHPLFAGAPPDWHGGILGLPLKIGSRTVGVMNVSTNEPHTWPLAEVRVLRLLADQAAIAIENARLHDEIRDYAGGLEQRVAERTASLEATAAELSQREAALSETAARLRAANESLREAAERLKELDRLKSEFLTNVSHELRTPLSNIKLYLDLLDRGKPGKYAQYMATLHRETALLQSLIEDLLQISRFDLGKVRPDLRAVDVNRLAGELVGDRTVLAADRRLVLRFEPGCAASCTRPEDSPRANADPRMLTQVLSNIITNALNYTPAGGEICVRTAADGQDGRRGILVSVSDTGPGIVEADRVHIFERFYRGAAAREARQPGNGLGLAICQELMASQGGTIAVESKPGEGSTFSVWLPAADQLWPAS